MKNREGKYPLTTSTAYETIGMSKGENDMSNGRVKQHIPKELRYSVLDFNNEFPNDTACLEYIAAERYPDGVTLCKACKLDRKHHRVGNRTAYACDHCGHHVYPLKGTIFEKSSTSLRLWFYAAYLMGSTRCGISAKQIQRETGVTYKTAWRMFNRLRTLLSDDDMQLEGPTVEIDETYVGGKRKGKFGRPAVGDTVKTPVVAIVQRKGKVIAKTVKTVTKKEIYPLIRKHVVPGSVIYTDEFRVYDGVSKIKVRGGQGGTIAYRHGTVRHADGEYVRGDAHTNSVEGFWMLVKTGIRGVYHSVSPKHLQSYLDEYSFRFNRRHMGNQQFRSILERALLKAS
jgi:transposase